MKGSPNSRSNHLVISGILLAWFVLGISLVGIEYIVQTRIVSMKIFPRPVPVASEVIIPILQVPYPPVVSAHAAVVMDDTSKVMLFAKNKDMQLPNASTTKMMTALIGRTFFQPTDMLTVSKEPIEGSSAGFMSQDVLSFTNMLYGMMLPSGNDAAFSIAQNIPGGVSQFVANMNKQAQMMHLTKTHYTDPAGIDETNMSSASDLARLASHLLHDPLLSQVVRTKKTVVASADEKYTYPLTNINKLLGIEDVDGVKTGYTDSAGQVLVSSTMKQGHRIILVVMKSDDRFGDTLSLLNYIGSNIYYASFSYPSS